MPGHIDIQKKSGYLLTTISEHEITFDSAKYILDTLCNACKDNKCNRVLIDERAVQKRTVKTVDIYNLGKDVGLKMFSNLKLAILCQKELINEDAVFFSTVAHNNASTINYFSNKDDAINWLKEGKER